FCAPEECRRRADRIVREYSTMKRLYDWFWETVDVTDNWRDQRTIMGLFGMAVLAFGLLMLWLTIYLCDLLGWNG
ncbi:MAG: hypothetical protein ACRYFZ_19985, partial [Janthinobacterium lividum]